MADTIIIIRGNSGSGKTTVANKLCDELGAECMLLSQDVIRRDVLHTKDGENSIAVDLLKNLILFIINSLLVPNSYIVIKPELYKHAILLSLSKIFICIA